MKVLCFIWGGGGRTFSFQANSCYSEGKPRRQALGFGGPPPPRTGSSPPLPSDHPSPCLPLPPSTAPLPTATPGRKQTPTGPPSCRRLPPQRCRCGSGSPRAARPHGGPRGPRTRRLLAAGTRWGCVGGVCVTNRVSPLRSGTPAPLTEALPSSSSQLPGAINHPFSTREAPLSPLRPARRRPPSGGGEERRGGKWPPPSAPAEGSTPGPRRKAPSASPLRFRLPSPSRPAPPPHLLRGPGGRSPRQEGGPGAGERRRRRQQPGHRPRQPHGRCRERGGGSGAAPGGRGGRPVGWAEVVWVVSLILGFVVVFFFTVGGCTVCPPVSSASPGDKPGLGSNRTLR